MEAAIPDDVKEKIGFHSSATKPVRKGFRPRQEKEETKQVVVQTVKVVRKLILGTPRPKPNST